MTRVTQLIHDAGKYLLISLYPLPTHPTHNFTHNNGGNLETLPGRPKKLQHNRPARSAVNDFLSLLIGSTILTHWGQLTHIYVGNLTIICSDNGLSPCRCQAIIWIAAGLLSIGPLRTYFNEIWNKIKQFHGQKCIWKCRLENGDNIVLDSMC